MQISEIFSRLGVDSAEIIADGEGMTTKQTCPRCGGSGHYSFNLKDGTICYGCNGSGFQMIDLDAQARKQAASVRKQAVADAGREAYKTAMAAVKAEFNARFGFDLSTLVGIDRLNANVFRSTGKDLVAHCKARLS